jgi:putative membrane protein
MMRWYGGGMGGAAWIFMGVFWIILIAAIIWLVVRLLPSNGQPGSKPMAQPPLPPQFAPPESPFDILDRRLAAGEIDLETYQAHRAALIAARGDR